MTRLKWAGSIFLLLLVGILLLNFNQRAAADGGTGTERYFTHQLNSTRYSWNVVAEENSELLCRVMIMHTGEPTSAEILEACLRPADPLSPTAAQLQDGIRLVLNSAESLQEFERIPIPAIQVQIGVPGLPVSTPFVTITAEEPLTDYWISKIYGTLNGKSFNCAGSACRVIVDADSDLVVWASSTLGDDSAPVSMRIQVTQTGSVYTLKIVSTSVAPFEDACSSAWMNVSLGGSATWSNQPLSAAELYTENRLYLLAAKLIQNKLVDASACPNGGLYSALAANTCGMDAAQSAVNEWQNRFNKVIFAAARDTGIPAKLLKSLIEQETQFWPGNVRSDFLEFGFGQLTEAGADVALRWDPELNAAVCEGLLFDCSRLFASQSQANQDLLRGGLMRWFDTDCPNCPYGVDISKAERSIKPLAQTVRSNCYQVAHVMEKELPKASYETLWKLTMLSYHSGYACMQSAVDEAVTTALPLTWEQLSSATYFCPSGDDYIAELWPRLDTYGIYTSPVKATLIAATPIALNSPTPTPTRTPPLAQPPGSNRTPTPTSVMMVNGKISVQVYVDTNNNGLFDEGEGVENVSALVRFSDNTTLNFPIVNGLGSAAFYDQIAGRNLTVSLPTLYRSITTQIPMSGNVLVEFRILPAALPTVLP